MKLYVGNLAYSVNDASLRALFEGYGGVESATVVMDRQTGRSKGFGFVEMPNGAEAQAAIRALNEHPLSGRNMRVNEAKPREARPSSNRRPY